MPVDDEARLAITLRQQTAYTETLERYASKPERTEFLGDMALAQEWLTISAAYSGIEQSLKYLIALQKDLTVDELLARGGIVEKVANGTARRTDYLIHELATLFSRMDDRTREAVERDYAMWQSLYDYIPMSTCAEFLAHIQGNDNRGHLDWRYCLIQGNLPPSNSADAMLAVWASLIRRCEEREGVPHRAGTRTAEEGVRLGLCECLERACMDYEQRAAENGEAVPPLRDELARWAPSGACMVNKMAALLGHRERYFLEVPEREGSKAMRSMLSACLGQLTRDAKDGMRGALPTFARRALGYFFAGETVRWNPKTMRFENVPWPLHREARDNAPPTATRVAPADHAGRRLRDIWPAACGDGYKVMETREFAANTDRPVQWHLRVQVYDHHEGADRPRISVWQEHDLNGSIAIEQHIPEEPLPPHMDLWLGRCKYPLRARWLARDEPA